MSAVYIYMDEIEPRLFLGSEDACDHHLQEAKITHVLSLREPEKKKRELPDAIAHWHIVIDDDESENILQHFSTTYQWIQAALDSHALARVLVHCHAGISRSATIVAHYLMKRHDVSNSLAIDRINQKRQVDPNHGFRWQLRMVSSLEDEVYPFVWRIISVLPKCLSDDRFLSSIIFACLFPSDL